MIYKDVLSNGLRVITQEMPDVYSVTVGIWTDAGSSLEDMTVGGVSHFLEHMLFKGTETRSAKRIAECIEEVGGSMNAFTSKEHTCYYVKVLAEHFEMGLDVLSDMFLNSTFDPEEFTREKEVILEEINMYEDTPDDVVNDLFNKTIWPEHPYGRPIIGNLQTVGDLSREDLFKYYRHSYAAKNTVLVVAGKIRRDEVLAAAERYFQAMPANGWDKPVILPPGPQPGRAYVHKDIEQSHVTVGVPGLAGDDEDIYKLHILSNILGGGVCSRLFQEAREKRGLSYSIYAHNYFLVKGGSFWAYASTSPRKVEEVLRVIVTEMMQLARDGVTSQELMRAQEQLKCSLLLGLESTGNVMSRLGRLETNYGRIITVDEAVQKIEAVSKEDVLTMAKKFLAPEKFVLAQVGPQECTKELIALL